MAHQVKIPAAGESINSATVGQWHKQDGEAVEKGDVLATIETDKVSTELEAEAAGTLHIAVGEGEEVAIGTVIAEIEEKSARKRAARAKKAAKKAAKKQTRKKTAARKTAKAASKRAKEAEGKPDKKAASDKPKKRAKTKSEGKVIEIRVPAAGESITSATIAQWHKRDGESVEAGETVVTLDTDKVSAELDAEESGVLTIIAPEGKEVKIGAVIGSIAVGAEPAEAASEPQPEPDEEEADETEEEDEKVRDEAEESAEESEAASQEAGSAPSPPPGPEKPQGKLVPDLSVVPKPAERSERTETSDGRTTRKRMSTLRRKIATQLVKAQHTAAILTTFNEADMSAVMKLRKAVQDDFVAKHGVKLGFMSFFVKAAVQALKEVPSVNGRIDGDEIVQNHFYDIGIAVGTEKGLIVPVVRDADRKSFAQIEQDILDYANKAREGKIQLDDLQGGSFTISNGGVYGSLLSTPILNPPQSGILGMHTIQQRPVAIDGQVEIRPMMYLALTYDHRIVARTEAVSFLIHVKNAIENPTRLMLELA